MIFAQFLVHPLATDPVTKMPTGGYDTLQMVDAVGSDSYVPLDGRLSRRRQIQETIRVWEKRKTLHPGIVGFEIRSGTLLKSSLIYRAAFDSLDLAALGARPAPVRIEGPDIIGQIRGAVAAGAKVTMLDDETLTRLASNPEGETSPRAVTLLRQISLTATVLEQIAQVIRETGIAYEPVEDDPEDPRGTYVMLQAERGQDFSGVLRRFEALWGPRRTFQAADEIEGADQDEPADPDETIFESTIDGWKVGGCLIVQCETGEEDEIRIYPSINPEPATA